MGKFYTSKNGGFIINGDGSVTRKDGNGTGKGPGSTGPRGNGNDSSWGIVVIIIAVIVVIFCIANNNNNQPEGSGNVEIIDTTSCVPDTATSPVVASISTPQPAVQPDPTEVPDYYNGNCVYGTDFDWLSERYCTEEDLIDSDPRILRNSIYARHGRRFKDSSLQWYFEKQDWYNGYRSEIPSSELNEYEKYNIEFIKAWE